MCHILYAVNDTLEHKKGTYTVTSGNTGEVVSNGEYDIAPNSFAQIGSIKADYSQKCMYMINWDGGCNHYISGNVPYDLEQYKKWFEIIKENYGF